MVRFITKRPGLTLLLVLVLSCVAFGPAQTGAWIGVHGRQAIVGAWRFALALFHGAF